MSELKTLQSPPEINTVYCCDALDLLRALPDESVNCIVTSPPYFGLRDYGVEGQIGLEETLAAYVAQLVELFREARRVLRDDGVMWLNLGDSYAQDTKWGGSTGGKHAKGLHGETGIGRNRHKTGLPGKNLIGIPWRVAFALQDDGWILRMDVIWSKPNAMPESVTDRPTKAHEYVFLFSKCADYWYDAEAIKEPTVDGDARSVAGSMGTLGGPQKRRRSVNRKEFRGGGTYTQNGAWNNSIAKPNRTRGNKPNLLKKRNKRSVWTVSTKPFSGAHFATFPPKLIEPMILAGCPKDGVVLDPFMGSGMTALVARALGRNWIGSELNPDYVAIARDRLRLPFEPRQVEQNNDLTGLPLFATTQEES